MGDLVTNRINSMHLATKLREATRWLGRIGFLLVLVLGCAAHLLYTVPLFDSYYAKLPVMQRIVVYANGFAHILGTFLIGWFFCGCVVLSLVTQVLLIMDFASAFKFLHPQIPEHGIERGVDEGLMINVSAFEIVRFQDAYLEAF